MKKFTLFLIALLSMTYMSRAQQYVSTEPSNRNVVLEEFTGRLCGYCPDGHIIANQIKANNPDRFWSVNIHSAGSSNFSTDTYPNLNTTKGNQIRAAFGATSFPSGVVNRSTSSAQGRGSWSNLANQQMNQAAECNVAGVAKINPDTRTANITVEVYYTGNSSVSENYLTVVMLQDSIMGSQSSGSTNPSQWINGQYCHMHVLRDIITPTMGEAISPTTQGTLITRTYEYNIPESIGDPNGVDVILDHISFLAWVSEKYQGTPTRPLLNACELTKTTLTDEPIYPMMSIVTQQVAASCNNSKTFDFNITNIGTDTLTSIVFNANVDDVTYDFEWNGELPSGENTKMHFTMDVPFGNHVGTLNITEANGETYESSMSFAAESLEWTELSVDGETTNIKLYIVQDQFGEQITWDIINSAGEVVASGGPYQHLIGSGSTQVNAVNINDIPANECYLFRIYDSNSNGICCNYGQGYYYFKDAAGNRFIEGAGDYGAEDKQLFSIHTHGLGVNEQEANGFNIYPNPANNKIYVDGEGVGAVEVYNSLGQKVITVEGSENTAVDVTSFENGVYMVRVITDEGAVSTKKVTIAH
ncbi:MAG: Omp28-related outer membrane protein [Bacteroidales bacterium]|nr:Omp28-related outer membrane protein [Bacteroidales bacterium]